MSQWRERLRAVAEHVPGGRVLDIGAGPGSLKELLRPGSTYTSLDLNSGDIQVDLNGVESIPGEYDVAVIIGVLEHLPDPRRCLRMALAVAPVVIFTYVTIDVQPAGRGEWKSGISEQDIMEAFPGARKIGQWDQHIIFRIERAA